MRRDGRNLRAGLRCVPLSFVAPPVPAAIRIERLKTRLHLREQASRCGRHRPRQGSPTGARTRPARTMHPACSRGRRRAGGTKGIASAGPCRRRARTANPPPPALTNPLHVRRPSLIEGAAASPACGVSWPGARMRRRGARAGWRAPSTPQLPTNGDSVEPTRRRTGAGSRVGNVWPAAGYSTRCDVPLGRRGRA